VTARPADCTDQSFAGAGEDIPRRETEEPLLIGPDLMHVDVIDPGSRELADLLDI
jgi:hypothetical protein